MLLGGTRVDNVLPVIKGSGIRYFPFPGRISGHPSVLEGSIDDIVESAKTMAACDGVHGLDLLAYRSSENVPELMKLRDREEIIEESDYILIPHGVEYRPLALDGGTCEVLRIA